MTTRPSLSALFAIALTVSLAGCVERVDIDAGGRRASLVNGTTTTAYPAVGILHSGGASACTATLIAKRAVITAAHCVTSKTAPYPVLSNVRFYVGGFNGTLYGAVTVAVHPNYGGKGNQNDIAVVRLNKDVAGVTPMPLSSTKPLVGEAITLLGYGLVGDKQGKFGTKRIGTNTVQAVASTVFTFRTTGGGTKSITCSGDSGGPTFAKRNGRDALIGVHSTSSIGCQLEGTDMRVDAYLPWINAQLTKGIYGSSCKGPSDCITSLCLNTPKGAFCSQECQTKACPYGDTCQSVSGGSITKACMPNSGTGPKKLGDTCTDALDCLSQICVPVTGRGSYCSERCEPAKKNCPATFFCAPLSGGGGVCLPGGSKKLGETCNDGLDCSTFICVAVPNKGNRCAQECDPTKQNCPSGFTCAPTTSGGGLCIEGSGTTPPPPLPPPPPPPPVKKKLGEPCSANSECETNLCPDTGGGNKVCVQWCERAKPGSCPQGYVCAAVAGQTTKGVCVTEPPGKLGERCDVHADCESKLCAASGGTKFCTQLCEPTKGCGAGWDCLPAGSGKYACAPAGSSADAGVGGGDGAGGDDDGGCALAPDDGSATPLALVLLGLLLLAILGRQRS